MAFDDFAESPGRSARLGIYSHIVYEGRIGSYRFLSPSQGNVAPSVTITASRNQPADRAVIDLTNFRRELSGKIKKGDEVEWWWNYLKPAAEVKIFSGYVVSVTEARVLKVEARDKMFNVLKDRRSQTFYNEEPARILSWFLNQAGVSGDLYEAGFNLPHFSAREQNASDVAHALNLAIKRHRGTDTRDWAHFINQEGQFVWGPFDTHSRNAVRFKYAFREGEDVLEYRPAVNELGRMLTMAKPAVRHSQLVNIIEGDGTQYTARTEAVTYIQRARKMRMEVQFQPWPPGG